MTVADVTGEARGEGDADEDDADVTLANGAGPVGAPVAVAGLGG